MFGIPIDTLVAWSTVISLSALAIAAAGTVVSHHLSARMNAAHVRELQHAQTEARTQIETSRAAAAQANARAAQLVRASAELQQRLQIEKDKPPEFLRASADPLHSGTKVTVPSDLLSRAE
jgi:hypothetical protein